MELELLSDRKELMTNFKTSVTPADKGLMFPQSRQPRQETQVTWYAVIVLVLVARSKISATCDGISWILRLRLNQPYTVSLRAYIYFTSKIIWLIT